MNVFEALEISIDDKFVVTHGVINDINDLEEQIRKLELRKSFKQQMLTSFFVELLALVATSAVHYNGRKRKVELIKIMRKCERIGLREAKDFVETFVQPQEDIPF